MLDKIKKWGNCFAIITDDTVSELYGRDLQEKLGPNAHLFIMPAGESYKTRETKAMLEDQMFEKGLGRDTCVIALGGGVVTDLAGFIAATYCRGVNLIMYPTTLLGMVDASIGGKTGVNLPYGKNLVGSYYPAKEIILDSTVLQTLSLQELRNGFVEMVKHGLIADEKYFDFLERSIDEILSLKSIDFAIAESVRIKSSIVSQDEKESGLRMLLNFGHTIGHAIELLSDYSITHGQAVAIGIIVESHMAYQLNYLNKNSFNRIHNMLKSFCVQWHSSVSEIRKAMILDKKSMSGKPRFIMIEDIGKPKGCMYVEEDTITKALEWVRDDLRCH